MKQYDAIIIGFGKGGKLLAAELANRNWKVAIIERSPQMYGGTCVNVGCIPTKALIYESEQAERLYRDDYGNQAKYYALAIRRKNKLVSFLRDKNHERIKEHPNITLYDGTASFVSDDTVKVVSHNKKEILLKGKEVFINTGATPILPAVKGIDASKHVFTSETLLQQSKLPGHLLILGAGAIGMEFATMYAGFGSKVTLLETGSRFMPKADRDIERLCPVRIRHCRWHNIDLYGQFRQYPLFLGRRRIAACHRTQTDDRRPQPARSRHTDRHPGSSHRQ